MKSIIFGTQMVQAILDGKKTQTRRVITSHTGNCPKMYSISYIFTEPLGAMYVGGIIRPRYQVGDVLWVRETWQHAYDFDGDDQAIEGTGRYLYAATDSSPFGMWVRDDGSHTETMPWRPSVHMPREAARIFLRVKNVRAERVEDISRADAIEEGFENEGDWGAESYFWWAWDELYAKRDYGVDANPWVWVIEFERCEAE